MSKWRVIVTVDCSCVVDVEAEDREQAEQLAMEQMPGSLCHYCARNYDLGDPIEAVDAYNKDDADGDDK